MLLAVGLHPGFTPDARSRVRNFLRRAACQRKFSNDGEYLFCSPSARSPAQRSSALRPLILSMSLGQVAGTGPPHPFKSNLSSMVVPNRARARSSGLSGSTGGAAVSD